MTFEKWQTNWEGGSKFIRTLRSNSKALKSNSLKKFQIFIIRMMFNHKSHQTWPIIISLKSMILINVLYVPFLLWVWLLSSVLWHWTRCDHDTCSKMNMCNNRSESSALEALNRSCALLLYYLFQQGGWREGNSNLVIKETGPCNWAARPFFVCVFLKKKSFSPVDT